MLEQGIQYSSSDFIALKAKVKEEMLRRKYTGSLEEYGGENYDFTIVPQTGTQILADQANKIITPINAVDDSGFSIRQVGDPAKAMNVLDAKITAYAAAPLEGENHYCKESCSGLCSTACGDSCGGECSDTCGGECATECGDECTGTCKKSCTGDCTGYCGGACAFGCGGDCTGQGCMGTCQSCTGSCTGSCQGGSTHAMSGQVK